MILAILYYLRKQKIRNRNREESAREGRNAERLGKFEHLQTEDNVISKLELPGIGETSVGEMSAEQERAELGGNSRSEVW